MDPSYPFSESSLLRMNTKKFMILSRKRRQATFFKKVTCPLFYPIEELKIRIWFFGLFFSPEHARKLH